MNEKPASPPTATQPCPSWCSRHLSLADDPTVVESIELHCSDPWSMRPGEDVAPRHSAPSYVKQRLSLLTDLATLLYARPLLEATSADLEAFLTGRPYATSTRRGYASQFRVLYQWCTVEGLLPADSTLRYVAVRKPKRVKRFVPPPTPWDLALADYLAYQRAAQTSAGAQRKRVHYLRRLALAVAPVGPFEVTPDQLIGFLGASPDWMPETRKSCRSSLRSFYKWAEDSGRVEADPCRRGSRRARAAAARRPGGGRVSQGVRVTEPPPPSCGGAVLTR